MSAVGLVKKLVWMDQSSRCTGLKRQTDRARAFLSEPIYLTSTSIVIDNEEAS